MRNITGAVASGDDFFDRQAEVTQFWRDLETDSLLLLAPRRVGKTSILVRLQEQAEQHGFQAAILRDVSDCKDELAFVKHLSAAILESDRASMFWRTIENSRLGQLFGRVQKAGGAGFNIEFRSGDTLDWERLGEELADALNRVDGQWLLLVDELPVFITNLLGTAPSADQAARIRQFLYWLRRLRLAYPKLRWLLTGSIGLDTVTSRLNVSDSINDLRIVSLGPFSESTAHAFLNTLAESYDKPLPEPVRQRILERVGWLAPFYLQLAFKQLREYPGPLTPEAADRAIDSLLEPQYKTHFDYWRQRLLLELDPADASQALEMLTAAARDPQGATLATLSQVLANFVGDARIRQERLRYLLDVLLNDGYLVEHDRRYRFRFPLLREYWLRRVAPPSVEEAG